jgi:hypothetical protein
MRKKLTFFIRQTLLVLCALIGTSGVLWAATGYEVSGVSLTPAVVVSAPVQMSEPLLVTWTAPSGTNPILGYYLKISAENQWTTLNPNDSGTYDFAAIAAATGHEISADFFKEFTGSDRYLHIITQYLDTQTNITVLSDDVVTGPIRIDNVAPTGTITLNPTSGNSRVVNVSTISPSESIKYYWLSDSATFPGGTGIDFATYPSGAVEIKEGTSYGNVTIHAWFQDQAGNRSTAASASAVYNYMAPTSIQYNSSSINVDASLVFTVDGATTYDWTITDQSGVGVAEFSGSATGVHSATVVGKKVGTFTVSAIPTAGGTALKTGTITVVQTTSTKQFSLVTGLNIISLSKSSTGWLKAADVATAVGATCLSLTKWDASKQGFVAHIKGTPLNNFDLVEGDGYFVNVNGVSTFAVTGQTLAKTFGLVSGLNLVGMLEAKSSITKAADLANNIGSTCLSLTKWDASKQGFVAHIKGTPLNNFDVGVGEGYFVNVNANTQW